MSSYTHEEKAQPVVMTIKSKKEKKNGEEIDTQSETERKNKGKKWVTVGH